MRVEVILKQLSWRRNGGWKAGNNKEKGELREHKNIKRGLRRVYTDIWDIEI